MLDFNCGALVALQLSDSSGTLFARLDGTLNAELLHPSRIPNVGLLWNSGAAKLAYKKAACIHPHKDHRMANPDSQQLLYTVKRL